MSRILLILVTLLISSNVQANTVNLNYVSPNTVVATQVSVNHHRLRTYIGSYNLQVSDIAETIVGFCVDPFQWANKTPTIYDRSALDASDFFSGNGVSRLINAQKLYDNAYAGLSSNEQTAGFHLALWEIFHDDLNTSTGIIRATNGSNAGMLSIANTFLAELNGWRTKNLYDLTFYKSNRYQDFLVATEKPATVPLPAALPLLASGLLGFSTMRRRKT